MLSPQIKRIDLCRHIYISDDLCPVMFESSDKLFDTVNAGLLNIAEFWWRQAKKIFSDFEQQDFVVCGDLVGYVYNHFCEVSIGVVADINPKAVEYLAKINDAFVATEIPYKFINRPVHCRFLTAVPDTSCYSLTSQKWLTQPQRQNFNFSMEDFGLSFARYQDDVHAYVATLPKHENGFLSMDGCLSLEQHLHEMQQKAQQVRWHDNEHEYSLDYLLWRTFREIGGARYFHSYLADSYNHNINELA